MKLETFADLAAQPPSPDFLVEGVLPRGMLAMMYGASGSGKTFLALDMAHAVATGRPWLGRPTREGRALYVAAEGGAGFPGRVQAWHRAHDEPALDGMRYLRHPLALHDQGTRDHLVEVLTGAGFYPLDLLIIDTASANAPSGFDDNKSEHWKVIFDAAADLMRRLGCAVLLIHHPGHAGDRLRGSYDQIARTDVIMRVERTGAYRGQVKLEKHRDFSWDGSVEFSLRTVPGTDLDGAEVLSLVPEAKWHQHLKLTTAQLASLRALVEAGTPLKAAAWQKASKLPKRTFYTVRRQLLGARHVRTEGSTYVVSDAGRKVVLNGQLDRRGLGGAKERHASRCHDGAAVPPLPPPLRGGSGPVSAVRDRDRAEPPEFLDCYPWEPDESQADVWEGPA